MNPYFIAGIVLFCAGLILICSSPVTLNGKESNVEAPATIAKRNYFPVTSQDAWKIVCNPDSGKFSFLYYDGRVSLFECDTRSEAELIRDERKKWCDEYTPEKAAKEQESWAASFAKEAEARTAKYKICP